MMDTNIHNKINKLRAIYRKSKAGGFLGGKIGRKESTTVCIELNNKIVVGTHHKTGTVWMSGIFNKICKEFGLNFYSGEQKKRPDDFDVFFQSHSKFDLEQPPVEYRGLHLIRDPRDRIVSGCFYHQKSNEEWLHIKKDEFGGLTYQEKINSFKSLDDQIMFEMQNSGLRGIREMLDWNYNNQKFYEVKYEDLISDKNLILFHKIYTFLGFPGKVIPQLLGISYENSLFSNQLKKSVHLRSGKKGQWENYFTPKHKAIFIELFGDALLKLGYESNHDWAAQ